MKQNNDFNCEILVTQGKVTNRYRLDDYRVATAIENLLHKIEGVDFKYNYKSEIKETEREEKHEN